MQKLMEKQIIHAAVDIVKAQHNRFYLWFLKD